MGIERFHWTDHALLRLRERRLDAGAVEALIRSRHEARQTNDGRAQWRLSGTTSDGTPFEVIYDHPHGLDARAARIVSAWRLE